jgi:D-alanyl-lipoteichoic acid acyltransferase DltB (MBOAT superfamily)
MLFNSYEFIFIFIPITLIGFWYLSRWQKPSLVLGWLIFSSLIFYLLWKPRFILILLFSVGVNWAIGNNLTRQWKNISDSIKPPLSVKLLLISGISFNLGLLGYFKYSNFFIDTINQLGFNLPNIENLVLPLGISFYTFEQISYLVGVASGRSPSYSLPRYLLFVTFFPHLIAGPILTADELVPQFRLLNYRLDFRNLAIGFTVFSVGLFKKAVIADSIAGYATPVFNAADGGEGISFFLAWQAAIAYTLQLYFDFSGYSDMAIGLAKMVNIKLPINFFSPYQAISIGDFWRRWHITLSRFLRDYLYIPLGGSRRGEARRYINLCLTMLLGGLWHGASWGFVLWGGLHGVYLCIDHGWRQLLQRRGLKLEAWYHYWAARFLTLGAIVVSWVIFRAKTLNGAGRILTGMVGGNGFVLPPDLLEPLRALSNIGIRFEPLSYYGDLAGQLLLLAVLSVTLFLPNLYQFMASEPVALDVYRHLDGRTPTWYSWRPNLVFSCLTFGLFMTGLIFCRQASEFLYFQF